MKTRLQRQIEEKQNELNTLISFSIEKHELFIHDLNSKIIPTLAKYKAGVYNPCDNTFVDEALISKELLYKAVLSTDLSHLTIRQRKNLSAKLKELGVPLIIPGVATKSITVVYR